MEKIKFIRAVVEADGSTRIHPMEAYLFLLHHGWLVADVMRYEEGMTFNEIVQASFELLEEYPSRFPSNVQEPYIAWCLIKLMEFGMVEIE